MIGFTRSEVRAAQRDDRRDGIARRYAGQYCMLNGSPAIVCGRRNDFATIAQTPSGIRAEFAWETVAHVFATKGGSFAA